MKNTIVLIVVLFAAVLLAGCTGLNSPTPTQTAEVSPTIVPTTTVSPSVIVIPLPTAAKTDAAVDRQVSFLIGQWAENQYGWNNDTNIRDVTFERMDGNDYIYHFTASGQLQYARVTYSVDSGVFTLANVSDSINQV